MNTITVTDLTTLPRGTVRVSHRHLLPEAAQGDTVFLLAEPTPDKDNLLLVSAAGNPNVRGFWAVDSTGVIPNTSMVFAPGTLCWWMARDGVLPEGESDGRVTEPEIAYEIAHMMAPLHAEVATLRDSLTHAREGITQERSRHIADISLIGEALLDHAEQHSWCGTFDEAVAELNANLSIELPTREREVEVEVSGFLKVPFSQTVTVSIAYEEDPEEKAMEEFNNSYAASDVSANDYDAEFTDEEHWTVEEA